MPPRVHPADSPRPASSEAEKRVWKALRDGLPAPWTAWHSLRIRDRNNYLGEGDFVLAHPEKGLLVLEVKGGRVEQRDGRWFTNGHPMEKAPLDQALGFVKKLVRRLSDFGSAPPSFGAAVAFPDTDFDAQPAEDALRGVVLGASHLRWIAEALPAVAARALPAPQAARGSWMERLHHLWGESWVPALSLGSRVRALGERRFALSEEQLEALDGLAENRSVLVQGGAGSGKTLLAAEAARRQAAEGRRTLLLCFTAPLRTWLAARLEGTGVEVQTVSGLAKEIADAAGAASGGDLTANEVWRAIYERAADAWATGAGNGAGRAGPPGTDGRPWDAVVVDEGQDLTFEAWWFVRTIAEGARLWAFHDPGQGYWADRAPPEDLFATRYRLRRGQRCPPGIEALARRFAAGSAGGAGRTGAAVPAADAAAIEAARKDGTLRFVPCPDPARTAEVVGAEVDRLLAEGVALADVGIVSLRGQTATGSILQAERLGKHPFVLADHPEMEERLVADTFLRWKGLERPVIVVADVPAGALGGLDAAEASGAVPGGVAAAGATRTGDGGGAAAGEALRALGTRMHIALTRALVAVRVVGGAG